MNCIQLLTPFANIFIHSQARTNELGDDLFPRSFITVIPTPSDYVGPDKAGTNVLCPECKEPDPKPKPRLMNLCGLKPSDVEGKTLYRAVGISDVPPSVLSPP